MSKILDVKNLTVGRVGIVLVYRKKKKNKKECQLLNDPGLSTFQDNPNSRMKVKGMLSGRGGGIPVSALFARG